MNYFVILKCGLMLFAFFIPMLAFSLFMDFYYMSIFSSLISKGASDIEIEQARNLFFWILTSGIVALSMIVLIAISGITHILRNLIWGEGIFFASDFAKGIKANTPKNLIFGFIVGVIFFGSFFVVTLFNFLFAAYIPLIIFAAVFFPVYFWMMFLNNTYSSKWTELARNGFYFYIKNIGWSLLGILMPLSLTTFVFMPLALTWLKYILLVLLIVFVFPIMLLIMTLFTTSKFDEEINREYYPDYYLRGLNHD